MPFYHFFTYRSESFLQQKPWPAMNSTRLCYVLDVRQDLHFGLTYSMTKCNNWNFLWTALSYIQLYPLEAVKTLHILSPSGPQYLYKRYQVISWQTLTLISTCNVSPKHAGCNVTTSANYFLSLKASWSPRSPRQGACRSPPPSRTNLEIGRHVGNAHWWDCPIWVSLRNSHQEL